jgi:hypothetical protein
MNKKGIAAITIAALICCTCGGCGSGSGSESSNSSGLPQGAYENEILTTKAVDQDKTMITVRVEFGT